jgi:hypothetical protein
MKQVLIILLCFTSSSAFAGRIRYQPKQVAECKEKCTEEEIKAAAPAAMKVMVNWVRAEKRWEDAKIESAELKEYTKNSKDVKVWVIKMTDEKAAELSKKTRYLFISDDGKVLRTNLTGDYK